MVAQNARKPTNGRGSAPDPAGGAYSAPPDSLASGEIDWLPPLQLPPAVDPLDLASPVPHTKIVHPLDSGWRCPCISYRLRLKLVCFPVCRVAFTVFAFKCGVCFFHIVGYISTVVCCLCLCNLRNSAVELMLQNFVNLCNQRPPEGIRVYEKAGGNSIPQKSL